MLSDEEKKAIDYWKGYMKILHWNTQLASEYYMKILLDLIEKQSKEIEELKETLKCTQNSWFEDTQKIEEMKKQIDLDNECEIALNNKIMDLEKEIEELKEKNKELNKYIEDRAKIVKNIQTFINKDYVEQEYISKDKIKVKIEEIDEVLKGQLIEKIRVYFEAQKEVLQSLLEKE